MKKIFFIFYLLLSQLLLAKEEESFLSNLYFGTGLNLNMLQADGSSAGGVIGGGAKIGYSINQKYAIELRNSTTLFDEENDLRIDNGMSLHAKVMYDFENFYRNELDVYVLGGAATNTISNHNRNQTSAKVSPSLGLGVEYKLSDNTAIYSDYTYLSSEVSQINFGFAYYFQSNVIDFRADQVQQQKLEERLKEEKEEKLQKQAEEADNNQTKIVLRLLHKEDTSKPIFVYLYELTSVEEFKRLDYSETVVLKKGTLDGDVVGDTKLMLKPAILKSFEIIPKNETRFFAIVATIDEIEKTDNWRLIKKLELDKTNVFNLMFDHQKVMEFK